MTAAGAVGIGTTTPNAQLEAVSSSQDAIDGTSSSSGGVGVSGNSTSGLGVIGNSDTGDVQKAANHPGIYVQATDQASGTDGVMITNTTFN